MAMNTNPDMENGAANTAGMTNASAGRISLMEAIEQRHSVRQYQDKPLPASVIAELADAIYACNEAGNLHIQLITNEPEAFAGGLAKYGKFSGVRNYIAMVGRKAPDLEERCGYYVSSEMKRVWAVELDLYAMLARVCSEHGISHHVALGTMLGAVRHGGFIPWDDDFDVMVPRRDYDFLCTLGSEFTYPYFLQTFETDAGYASGHAQLRRSDTTAVLRGVLDYRRPYNQGVFIDIFPLDAVPDDDEAADRQGRRVEKLKYAANMVIKHTLLYGNRRHSAKAKLVHPLVVAASFGYPHPSLCKRVEAECSRYEHAGTDRVSTLSFRPTRASDRIDRVDLEETVMMDFEFARVPVPSGYDRILTTQYGDYKEYVMGTTEHGGVLFDLDRPYSEWLDDYFKGSDA